MRESVHLYFYEGSYLKSYLSCILQEGVNFFRKTSTHWSYQYGGRRRRTAVVPTEPQTLEIRNLY